MFRWSDETTVSGKEVFFSGFYCLTPSSKSPLLLLFFSLVDEEQTQRNDAG